MCGLRGSNHTSTLTPDADNAAVGSDENAVVLIYSDSVGGAHGVPLFLLFVMSEVSSAGRGGAPCAGEAAMGSRVPA